MDILSGRTITCGKPAGRPAQFWKKSETRGKKRHVPHVVAMQTVRAYGSEAAECRLNAAEFEENSTGRRNLQFVLFESRGLQEKCGSVCRENSTGQRNLQFVLFECYGLQEKCGSVCRENSTGRTNKQFVLFAAEECRLNAAAFAKRTVQIIETSNTYCSPTVENRLYVAVLA